MAIVIEELGYQVPVKGAHGEEIGTFFQNSGIAKCAYIDSALTLIRTNPTGFPIIQP